jgi:uncharacterized protein (DUF1800 family)
LTTVSPALSVSEQVAHLYRRAGFGARAPEIAIAAAQGYAATLDDLLSGLGAPDRGADTVTPPALLMPPAGEERLRDDPVARRALLHALRSEAVELMNWWLARMVATTNPLAEKLTFLLHGHFPTAISKVRYPVFMFRQNQLFRTAGSGDFAELTQRVATDPAMLIWLDAATDKASHPNQNFARELMERFTMGIGSYTEQDVQAAAYCFTGWTLDMATGSFTIDVAEHASAPQNFLGRTGINTGQQVVEIATHSAASARYVPAAFWSHLAYPVATTDPVVSDLAPGYAADRDVGQLLRSIFTHPEFVSPASIAGLIKQPAEYVAGALRACGVGAAEIAGSKPDLIGVMAGLGQVLFDPPSVGGWPQNEYWLSTAAALMRWKFAARLAKVADISAIADVAVAARADAAAEMLGVSSWSAITAGALRDAAPDPVTLATLALVSPEYVSN